MERVIEVDAGRHGVAVRSRLPDVELDVHLGSWVPWHPPRVHRAPRARMLLDRCRPGRHRRSDEHRRMRGDAASRGVRAPRRGGREAGSSATTRACTPASSTVRASSSTRRRSRAGEGAPCTWQRVGSASHRSSGSRRCAGSCRSTSTGASATSRPRSPPCGAGPDPTGEPRATRWPGAAPRSARPTSATDTVVESLADELVAMVGETVYVELRRRIDAELT